MSAITNAADTAKYIRSIEASKKVRWDIDRDVIRGRRFDFSRKFLPDGISKVHELDFLDRFDGDVVVVVKVDTGRLFTCIAYDAKKFAF